MNRSHALPRSATLPRSAAVSSSAVISPSAVISHSRRRHRALRHVLRTVLMVGCLLMTWTVLPEARSEGARWQWPVAPPHPVVRAFEPPAHDYGPGHRGIDIGASGPGAQVRAVEAGTVHFAGAVAGRGVVSIRHVDGLLSTYEPVTAALDAGAPVAAGDVIGAISSAADGGTHCPGETCLHLGARRGTDYIDPMLLLGGRGPSVLLPWGDEPAAARTASGASARTDPSAGSMPSASDLPSASGGPSAGSVRTLPRSAPRAVLLE